MSEYQYYEFLALERPLTREEQQYMRDISSRGHITPVSYANHYSWGDFKGNRTGLMQRFYDAHVYLNNCGTAVFMLRVPLAALDRKSVEPFTIEDVFEGEATTTHWVLTWSLGETEDYDRFSEEDGPGWMARLAPLREELVRGDRRSLYIGWLAAVSQGLIDDDESEPYLSEGLAPFSAAQQALAEFLDVDTDLLNGAGSNRPHARVQVTEQEVDAWLATVPEAELRSWVKQLLTGQGQEAERAVKRRFDGRKKGTAAVGSEGSSRMVADLWELAEGAGEVRQFQEKERQERERERQRQEREQYLAVLSVNFPTAWRSVTRKAEVGSGKAYDEACQAILDLKEAYTRHATWREFDAALQTFLEQHRQRKSLVQRLVTAGVMNQFTAT